MCKEKDKHKLTIYYEERHISKVITSSGCVLTFAYQNDLLVEVKDEIGRTVRYKYENDCLKAVCHVDEGTTTYHYDDKNHVTQVIDQNGHAYVTNEYDEVGRVIAQYYLDGTKSVLTYDSKNRENTVYIEALNRTERYQYNEDSLVTHTYYDDGTYEEIGYDKWSNHIYEKDRNGNETRRVFDVYGNLLTETLPSGQIWNYEYHENGTLLSKKANTGEEITYTYNEDSFLIEKAEKIQEEVWKHTSYERDEYGRILQETDSLGNVTKYSYDNQNGYLFKEPSSIKNAMGHKTQYEYDVVGRVLSITNEYGTVEQRYNLQSYPTYVRDGNGNELRRTYDKLGNVTALFSPNEGADGKAWMYQYDFFDRLIETRDPLGNRWKKKRNLAGDILCETTPEGYETHYEYDTDSHKLRTIYPDGSIERCFYDGNGNLIKKVRPESYNPQHFHTLSFSYDALNRLTQVKDTQGAEITYTYDCLNQKTSEKIRISQEVERNICYVYDVVGNLMEQREAIEERFLKPKGKNHTIWAVTRYEYDKNGNCIKIISPKGYETKKDYDVLDRLISEEEKDKTNGIHRKYQYEYDKDSNLIQRWDNSLEGVKKCRRFLYDSKGRLTHLTDEIGATTRLFYDQNDRIAKVVRPEQ